MLTNNDSERIEALDLTPIKVKLMHAESGEGWPRNKADAVEREYRRFLHLTKKYPNEQIAPSEDVDAFWHYHILDTMKYASDCEQLFGYFLHHYPYLGMGDSADAEALVRAGERMSELYQAEFGGAGDEDNGAWREVATKSAWCAGPGKAAAPAANDKTAWCAAPGKAASPAATGKTAWCAAPGKAASPAATGKTAWCAAPGKAASAAANAKTAWCAAPGKAASPAANAKTAWCAAPGKAASPAANAKTAWCAAPGKPVVSVVAKSGYEAANTGAAWWAVAKPALALAA